MIIAASTGAWMVRPANTATAQLICGKEEHTHTDACYTAKKVLTCGQEESAGHQHTDACCSEEKVLTCGREEHTHTAKCYEKGGTLTAEAGNRMSASVSYDAGVLHEGTSMAAAVPDKNTIQKEQSLIRKAAGGDWKIAALYSYALSFSKDGREVEPDGEVHVTMNFRGTSADAENAQWKIYHITDAGQAEEITEKGNHLSFGMIDRRTVGSASFTASSFSDYVLTALVPAEAEKESASEKTANTEETEKKQETAANETEKKAEIKNKNAAGGTGDAAAKTASAAKKEPVRRAAANADGSVDLTSYLTGFTAYKKNGDKWEAATHFNDGDSAKFTLDFEVKSGQLNPGQRTLTYSLPEGTVLPTDGQSGKVTQNGVEVGDYSISSDGKIKITLNDQYDINTAFKGNITFEGIVKNTGGSEGTDVNFNTDDSIHIGPKAEDTDLYISKQAYLQTSGEYAGYIQYRIRVYSIKGTSGEVYLDDQMTGLNSFSSDQVKGWSVVYDQTGGEGTEAQKSVDKSSEITPAYYPANDGRKGWYLTLPQMEKPPANWFTNYWITYYVKPDAATAADGKQEVGNTASANDGIRWVSDTASVQIRHSMVSKSVTADDTAKKLHWTIVIKNTAQRHDLSQDFFKDQMTVDGVPVAPPDTIYIGNQAIHVNADGTFTLPQYSSGEYTITYDTDYPEGPRGTHKTVKNTIEYKHGDETYTSETSRDVVGTQSVYDVNKWNYPDQTQTDADGNGATLHWASTVYLPEETIEQNKVIYTDTLSAQNGSTDLSDKHYTTADLLNQMIVWPTTKDKTSGSTLTAGTDYKIYDISDGSEKDITGSADSSSHITKFKVVLTDTGLGKVQGMYAINYSYNTRASYDGQKGKSTWTFSNTGEIPDHKADASFDHQKDIVLDKMSSATGPYFQNFGNGNYNYKDAGVTVDQKDGIIYYAVILKVPQGTSGDMVLTDTFPAGLSYKVGSASIAIYGSNDDATRNYSDGKGQLAVSAGDPKEQTDGTSKVDFTVTGYRPGEAFVLYYQAQIQDEDYWKDQTHTDKDYENKIEWDKYSDTTTIHAEQNKKVLDKTHQLEENADGTRKLTYYLKVNPSARDLDSDSDTLTLTDTLKTDDSGAKPYFNPATIKVYQYDADMPHGVGTEIDKSRYTYQYDEVNHKLTVNIPDQLACVVSYQYNVTIGVNDTIVSNSAELTGVADSSASDQQKLTTSSSSSSVQKNTLILYKVDSDNYRIKLSGVTFKVQEYSGWENNQHVWKDVTKDGNVVTKTTDQNGVIRFTTVDDGLKTNTLYRLVETDAGDNPGYEKSDESYMFIWKDEITYTDYQGNSVTKKNPAKDDYWNYGILPNGAGNLDRSKVNLIDGEGNAYFPNEKRAITVNKVWLNADNKDLNDSTKTATVELWRKYTHQETVQPETVNVTVTLKSSTTGKTKTTTVQVNKNDPNAEIYVTNDYWNTFTLDDGTTLGKKSYKGGNAFPYYPIGAIDSDTSVTFTSDYNADWWMDQVIVATDGTAAQAVNKSKDERAADAKGNVYPEVTLTSSSGWSNMWTDLPAADSDGNKYYYYVKETRIDGKEENLSNYDTSSTNNDGIEKGTITVTNKSKTQVQHASFDFTKKWIGKDSSTQEWQKDITVTLTGTAGISSIQSDFTIHRNDDGTFTAAKSDSDADNAIKTYSFAGSAKDDGGYQLKFTDLPYADSSGNVYTYTLTEKQAEGYGSPVYTDAADENGSSQTSITTGQTIRNKEAGGYQLPSTGGPGTIRYIGSGALLMAAAMLLYIKKKSHERGQASS